jgi:uncharacterized spore protein YtfJ
MDLQQTLAHAQDAMTAKRVYGEPYERDELTIIPAAAVRGGGGAGSGGADDAAQGGGGGGGFGLHATPKGAWVIEHGNATWKPAVDVNRIVLGGQVVAFAALMTVREIVKQRGRQRSPRRAMMGLRHDRRHRLHGRARHHLLHH